MCRASGIRYPCYEMVDAHQIAQEIASGKVSVREVVAASIQRIEKTHAAVNAVVVPRFEEALKEADVADAARVDAILCPIFPVPALNHRVSPFIDEGLSYTAIYNLLGMPAGVVAATRVAGDEEMERRSRFSPADRAARRVESGSAGLPVGIQVVARHWREDIVLGIMLTLEEHFRRQPMFPFNPPPGGQGSNWSVASLENLR
jgi:Asp-tRNA(Asn)/Glu-tRNA(Gln) amidotransferase A subunit family amidase